MTFIISYSFHWAALKLLAKIKSKFSIMLVLVKVYNFPFKQHSSVHMGLSSLSDVSSFFGVTTYFLFLAFHCFTLDMFNLFRSFCRRIIMWEEGKNTKPQIYYNNNNAGTPQASKRKKKGNSDREMENTHTK